MYRATQVNLLLPACGKVPPPTPKKHNTRQYSEEQLSHKLIKMSFVDGNKLRRLLTLIGLGGGGENLVTFPNYVLVNSEIQKMEIERSL